MRYRYSVFTKPFRTLTAAELGAKVAGLGFSAVEFPLRPGYQVEPGNAAAGMAALARTLADFGVSVSSVATGTDEACFAGVAAANCKILRIMAPADKEAPYLAWEERFIGYLESLVPLCERYAVTVGVQNHYGRGASGSMELLRLVQRFSPRHIAAVWDAAHSGLAGEAPEQALEILAGRVCLVNFKNAYYRRANGPEAPIAEWKPHFTLGRHGQASYPRIAAWLKTNGYGGDICLPAEYSDEALVEELLPEELAFVKSLMES